jgi:outer membrane protein
MLTKKLSFISAGFFGVLFVSSVAFASDIKVGTVDVQKALQEVKKGRDAKSTLETEFNAKKKKIEEEQTSLKKGQEDLEKAAKNVALSQGARDKKMADFQKRAQAFQELVQRSQMEMQQREVDLTKPIIEGIRVLVAEVAKKKKIGLVFEANSAAPNSGGVSSNPLLYAEEKVDLTDDVIKSYDDKNK